MIRMDAGFFDEENFGFVTNWALVLFPFLAAIAVALAMLLLGSPEAWKGMLLGARRVSSAHCVLCIPLFAGVPLAALIWALRKGAPTRLKLCGAIAGIVAGGIGAAAYALSCASDVVFCTPPPAV